MNEREPIALDWNEALERHVQIKQSEDASPATIRSHKSRLGIFIDWVQPNPIKTPEEDEGPRIETTDQLHQKHLQDYRLKRADEVAKKTLKTQMDTLRVFLRNMEDYGAVREGIHQHVRSPSLKGDEGQRSDHLPIDRGEQIRSHLREYEWGSKEHVMFELLWGCAMRVGDVHSIDEEDVNLKENFILLEHRPEEGTTLKNGNSGERIVAITDTVSEAIQSYINNPERNGDVTDDHGRNPLLTSSKGRLHKQTIRSRSYAITRPCVTGNGCPHDDRDPDECRAARNMNRAYECPSSKSPHALRSGGLTRMRDDGIPPWIISERVDASEEVIEQHYNEMTEEDKMEVRRQYFDDEYEGAGAD